MSGSDPTSPNGARGRPGRGFDPLSSLFEPPDPSFDGLSAGGGPRPQAQQVAAAALTDEKFRAPPDVVAPASPPSPGIDREAIAKAMAKAAMAKLAAQPAAPPAAPVAPVAAAPAPKAPAKSAARPAPPPPAKAARPMSALEAARLAAAAEEAARSAAAQEAAARPAPPPAPPAAAPPAPAAPPASAAGAAAVAPVVAAPAVAAPVASTPAPAPSAAAPASLLAPADAARAALRSLGGEVEVPLRGAVAAPRGPVLGVLWKSHRLRALAEGDLALAHAAARITDAVERAPESLVVALAGAAGQEHLLFVDARGGRLLAVCGNARAYLAATGLQL
ncbi:MAG: hypothetical protein JNM72_24575 [Deltaproteobacteria bacterium]|nr:hypothetical protein [Deltaproteobacteria bacterium]